MAIDPLKIVVEVQNRKDLELLTQDAKNAESEILRLNALFKQTGDPTHRAGMMAMAESLGNIRGKMKDLEVASHSAGRGLSQLAYAVDDMQYGFNAIVNNIPQIVMGLGGGAGIAGAIGIAAVAINQLIKHWDDLTDKLQSSWSGVPVAQLEKMRAKAEEVAKAFEKILSSPTPWDKMMAEGTAGTIGGYGAGYIASAVMGTLETTGMGAQLTEEESRKVKEKQAAMKNVMPFDIGGEKFRKRTQQEIDEILKRTRGENAAETKRLIVDAEKPGLEGDAARARLGNLARANPGAFPPDFLERLQVPEPEKATRAAADAHKQARAKDDKAVKERLEERGKHKEEADKDVDHWRQKLRENDKRDRIEALSDQREALEDQRKRTVQKFHDEKAQGAAAFGSTKDYISSIHEASASMIPKQQLEVLKEIDKQIKNVHDAIKNEQRAGRFG